MKRKAGSASGQTDTGAQAALSVAMRRAGRVQMALVLVAVLIGGGLINVLIVADLRAGGTGLLRLALALALGLMGCVVALGWGVLRRLAGWEARAAAELARLRRATDAAQAASETKSRYLANVSHEIRSPLNAIYGYAQMIERGDGVSVDEAAQVIRRCAEHITSLVETLLDISQVENGVLRVKTEPVRLSPFLEQLARMVRPAAQAKGLDFTLTTQGRLPPVVRMDAGRVRQVLLNLLFNAIKFTDTGGVTLSVRYSGQIAHFDVRDTGPGIRPEDQAEIFRPYERGGDADALARPGAGLGLTISRAIVDILGGQLELVESDASGSLFRLTLMLGEVLGQGDTAAAPDSAAQAITGYDGAVRHVLLIDDDDAQRGVLGAYLRQIGFAVADFGDGAAAIAHARDHAADLAICDISMPGMSGWEVAARLRADHPDMRIVMLSANVQEFHRPEIRPEWGDPAHDHFLVKPVDYAVLSETLGQALGLHYHRRAAQAPTQTLDVPPVPEADSAAPITLEPEVMAHVTRLRELLRIGYVRGIEQEIRLLAEKAPHAKNLTDRLFACLDRFDLAGMARLLEHV
ncbi:response regulator [Novosphingobium sp. FSY-8]|uniref:histidine kinase n=1 Tax=Novosphingobium ovatum TaxID=1908523 RepID=A0ABW9X8Z7_9SPHN|nr:ATP-binding protein [Novosphingobium ovatum]NBC34998.1 response regulator [Novosphingobium ovatum]